MVRVSSNDGGPKPDGTGGAGPIAAGEGDLNQLESNFIVVALRPPRQLTDHCGILELKERLAALIDSDAVDCVQFGLQEAIGEPGRPDTLHSPDKETLCAQLYRYLERLLSYRDRYYALTFFKAEHVYSCGLARVEISKLEGGPHPDKLPDCGEENESLSKMQMVLESGAVSVTIRMLKALFQEGKLDEVLCANLPNDRFAVWSKSSCVSEGAASLESFVTQVSQSDEIKRWRIDLANFPFKLEKDWKYQRQPGFLVILTAILNPPEE